MGESYWDTRNTRTTTAIAISAATLAKPTSTPLTPEGAAAGRGAARRLAALRGAEVGAGAEVEAVGRGGAVTARAEPAKGAAGAGVAAATAPGAGILIVGAAVGLGGKLIRTVSFLGCTFAASEGFGGSAPGAGLGVFSDIRIVWDQRRSGVG